MEYLSPKQLELANHSHNDYTVVLARGKTRSGKSQGVQFGLAPKVIRHPERDYFIVGKTLESIMRNVGFGIISLFRNLGFPCDTSKKIGMRIVPNVNGREVNIWLAGSNDKNAVERMQGATVDSAIVDEATTIPEDVWGILWSRLSFTDSKIWATYNPDRKSHWLKNTVEDCLSDYNAKLMRFSFEDNPFLTEEVIERYRKGLKGHQYVRLVQDEWADAGGLIFPDYSQELFPWIGKEGYNGKVIYGLDWGAASVTCAVKMRLLNGKANVVDEWYYDAKGNKVLTDDEHAKSFIKWTNGDKGPIYADPNTSPTFKKTMRNERWRVINGKSDVDAGIRNVNYQLGNELVRISPDCKGLISELDSYAYDESKSDKGDFPIKMNDHLCDALRYAIHSNFKLYNDANLSVRKAGL